jgi:hypothetical protein
MKLTSFIFIFFAVSCAQNSTVVTPISRKGVSLASSKIQDPKISFDESDSPEIKTKSLPPITYYNYSDVIEANSVAEYSFYANTCIQGATYIAPQESKLQLKDSDDNLKLKTYSQYFFHISHELIDEENEICAEIYKEDRVIHSFEIPKNKMKSFVEIFAAPGFEVRRTK